MNASEYFAKGRRKLIGVESLEGHRLLLRFDQGERRILDMQPLLDAGGVFADIRSKERFDAVFLDEDGAVSWDRNPGLDSSLHWNNRISLCPDACYLDSVPL